MRRLGAPTGTDRFAAGKLLLATAAKFPERVYRHVDGLAGLLSSESKIVRWTVQRLLASLACVDGAGKIDALMDEYLGFIAGANMISAANAITGSAQIGKAKPHLVPRIVGAILGVEGARYESVECRNVAIGRALETLAALWPMVGGDAAVRGFVKRQCANSRPAAARRARFLTGLADGELGVVNGKS